MIGDMTKLKRKDTNELQSLDALLLLKASSHAKNGGDLSFKHDLKQFSSLDNAKKTPGRLKEFPASNKPSFNPSSSDRLSGGFDNVAFDLESLEDASPGSRKPLISVHLRTVSPEEYVLSTLNRFSVDKERVKEKNGRNCNSVAPIPCIGTKNLNNYDECKTKEPPSAFATDHYPPAINEQQLHSMPTHINVAWSPCKQSGPLPSSDVNTFNSLPPSLNNIFHAGSWVSNAINECPSEAVDNNNFFSISSVDESSSFRSFPKATHELNTSKKVRLKNSINAGDNEENELSNCDMNKEAKEKLGKLRLIERESENNENSLPSKGGKKMETVQAKKTEEGSFELTDTKQVFSFRETMVQVGGVLGLSPPNIQNVQVSLPSKTLIKGFSPRTKAGNVSQISVMNNLSASNRVSNVVISSGGLVAPTSVPTVSALSKVSSVRIVPSPVTTPTPSVIGGTSDTSSISSQPRSRPLSLARPNKINLRTATIPPRHPNVALLHASVHRVKSGREQQSIDPPQSNVRGESDPNRVRASSNTPSSALPPTPAGDSRNSVNNEPTSHCAQKTNSSQAASNSNVSTDNRGSQIAPNARSSNGSNNNGSQSYNINNTNHSQSQLSGSQPQINALSPNGTLRPTSEVDPGSSQSNNPHTQAGGLLEGPRRQGRERRRERRERRRERRALRNSDVPAPNPPMGGGQTELNLDPQPPMPNHPPHLPDLLNSHVPPPYSTLPNGPRSLGCLLGHPQHVSVGHPPPMSLQMPPPPPPPGPPMGSLGHFPPPGPPHHGPQLRPLPPENPWHFFGSRRSRGSPRCAPYISDEEAKSCCGLLVTQAVSIRWFIIMIAFVGLCCTVVGTVLGAVKTNSSEYVTITLLMIGVGIVLITVSGVAWHLTSRDAPCRVMLGLAPSGRGETRNRFMARMAPTFGRPHHPYAAMMYPEFQFRPPPPSYQASMQEYRLRLLLLDRQGGHHGPPLQNVPSPPPIYRHPNFNGRQLMAGTLGQESEYSRPPSYRSMEGSVLHHPDAPASIHPGGGTLPHSHSRDPSCLSFLSQESLYSTTAPGSMEGSTRRGVRTNANKISDVGVYDANKYPVVESIDNPSTSNKKVSSGIKDDNTVTIVQTICSSQVIGSESVIVTVSGSESLNGQLQQQRRPSGTEISVLAHL